MDRILKGLQPDKVFYYFEEISGIPRGSGNEKEISDFLYKWAAERKLDVVQDEALNILIKKPGSAGYENAPTVVLQGHMDMVCEKDMAVAAAHDFLKDPPKLRVDGDYVYASGTTLGADNGIAVAYAMALLDSEDIPHPPLEVLITTDEEVGMTGAESFDTKQLKGRIMINLDEEYEGKFTAGCAGGGTVKLMIPVVRTAPRFNNFYRLAVKGLRGGHSGDDIDKERGNAIKLLGRILYDLKDYIEISSIAGGAKSNSIPRESQAILSVGGETDLMGCINKWRAVFKNEFAFSDPDIVITVDKVNQAAEVYDERTKANLIASINLLPDGPLRRSTELDMVIYSGNLGVISSDNDAITLTCAPRSSTQSMLGQFVDNARLLSEALGIKLETSSFYPGWEYRKESGIRDLCLETYEALYGIKGEVIIIHAGLECGLFVKKIPDLDAISIGPDLYDIHTPNEHMSISSVQRTFDFLCKVLERINNR